jgi:anaerobic sulfite reductase subunit C
MNEEMTMSMQWTPDAEDAVKKVPFFVRKRVRARVEQEAREAEKSLIGLADVRATQKRYLKGMASQIKGYQLDMCFGPAGCPNRIDADGEVLGKRIEALLRKTDLLADLKSKGVREPKFHHEFRVTLADCPNACSQPQIKDIGIIAALFPITGEEQCTGCRACVGTCREKALSLDAHEPAPRLHPDRCMACGQCITACPTGFLAEGVKGYRIQLGGKLGRHPRLARELPGVYDAGTVLDIVAACLEIYKSKSIRGERFGELLEPADFEMLADRFGPKSLRNPSGC